MITMPTLSRSNLPDFTWRFEPATLWTWGEYYIPLGDPDNNDMNVIDIIQKLTKLSKSSNVKNQRKNINPVTWQATATEKNTLSQTTNCQ